MMFKNADVFLMRNITIPHKESRQLLENCRFLIEQRNFFKSGAFINIIVENSAEHGTSMCKRFQIPESDRDSVQKNSR